MWGVSAELIEGCACCQGNGAASIHDIDIVMNHRDLIVQMMVMRMLTEFCLMYGATVGVLLKRDTEKVSRQSCWCC